MENPVLTQGIGAITKCVDDPKRILASFQSSDRTPLETTHPPVNCHCTVVDYGSVWNESCLYAYRRRSIHVREYYLKEPHTVRYSSQDLIHGDSSTSSYEINRNFKAS